jgi:hypothetical protein
MRPGRNCAAPHDGQQPQHRPNRQHQPLGQRRIDEQPEEFEETHQPGIDQARPVDVEARGRRDTRLMHVVPALSGHEVAHLDQAHRVVGIRKRVGGAGPELGHELQQHQEPGEPQQNREIRPVRRASHHAQPRADARSASGPALRIA